MANETTSAIQAAVIATERLARGAIKANLEKQVMVGLLHHDTMDGAPAPKKRYPVESDLGTSSGGTEGTPITANTAVGYASSVESTPSEGVLDRFVITEKTVMERLGGVGSRTVLDIFGSGDMSLIEALLRPDINRVYSRGANKIETDALALLSGISNTVGSTGVDMTLTNALEAIYQLKTQNPLRPPSEWCFVLAPNQTHELNLEALTGSGGLSGIWTAQAQNDLMNRPGDMWSMNGLLGRQILGFRVYEMSPGLVPTANTGADVVGGLICQGSPAQAPDDPALGGKTAFGVYLARHGLVPRFEQDADTRGMKCVINALYACTELVDNNAVGIVTDAP